MKILMVTALLASACTGCMTTTSMGAGAQRKQFIIVSQHYVERQGTKTYKKLSGFENPHHYQVEDARLVKIMNQLIPYADEYLDRNEQKQWSIHHWDAKRVNTKALGNGTILIADQYLNYADFTDDDLALLIAHEMAHIIRHHPQEFYSWKYLLAPVLFASSFLTSGVTSVLTSAGQDVYGIGFRHSAESEADLLGLEIYAKAGYNPENAQTLMNKIELLYKKGHPIASKMPNWVKTQPSFKSRRKSLQQYQTHVLDMYQQHELKDSEHLIQWQFTDKQNTDFEVIDEHYNASIQMATPNPMPITPPIDAESVNLNVNR